MQKTNIKASILIWATFLSLIITFTFISISTSINKNLKNNTSLTNQFKLENQLENIINSWAINNTFINNYLDNWEIIFFKTNNIYISLKKNEKINIKITKDNALTVYIISWWPIETSSWLLINNDTYDLSDWNNFLVNNLWWYTKILISSDTENSFLLKDIFFKINKKIWNKNIIKTNWKIQIYN